MQGFKQFTILPMMIVVAMLAFSVRLTDVFVGVRSLAVQGSAYAAEDKAHDAGDAAPEEHAEEQTDHDDEEDHASDMSDDASQQEVAASDPDEGGAIIWRDAVEEDYDFQNTKMDYLRDLEQRRQVLDERERDLQAREALLKATQQEMERKYIELNQIRNQIEVLLKNQETAEQAQIMSLVKIYEGMKAKEAAVIFNTLDLDILLQVTMNMSERKASAILAKMNPERAKTLTVMLAEQKALPSLPDK